jgi:ankyrin repeat protein
VKPSIKEGFTWSMKAALSGNLKSKADVFRLSKLEDIPDIEKVAPQVAATWLADAAEKGSSQALKDLELVDFKAYTNSKKSWRQRFCLVEQDLDSFIPTEEWLMAKTQDMSSDDLDSKTLNTRGHTVLHVAASLGYERVVDEIVLRGANVNVLNNYDENPLLCACRSGNVGLAKKLLRNGCDIVASMSGETPLHWLIACDDHLADHLCSILVEHGANLEDIHFATETNEYNFDIYPHGTPLHWAVSRRHMGAIRALVSSGADPFNDALEDSPLIRAVSIHDMTVLELLLASKHATAEKVTGLDSAGQTLLFHAIYCNPVYPRLILHGNEMYRAFIDTAQLLIDHGCDPELITRDGDSVMHLAAGFCDVDELKLLLDNFPQLKTSINKPCGPNQRTPLHQAISSDKIDMVRFLISNGADCDVRSGGATLLHLLAGIVDERHALECLKELNISKRTDINDLAERADVETSVTAFEMALVSGHLAVADFLLTSGANPHCAPTRHPSFLHTLIVEVAWHSPASLEYYIEKAKPDFVVRRSGRITALHVAASLGSLIVDTTTASVKLDILLKAYPSKAQIDARTTKVADSKIAGGQTPLHYAAKFGVYFATKKLLEVGADVFAKDEEGHTPVELIRQHVKAVNELEPQVHSRPIQDMMDTLKMLESAAAGKPLETRVDEPSRPEGIRTRISRLGFQDAD